MSNKSQKIMSRINPMMTPLKVTPITSTTSGSPETLQDESSPCSMMADTPMAVDPSPQHHHHHHHHHHHRDGTVYYLEGIPEHLGAVQQKRQQQQLLPPPPEGFDDASLESILSSLDSDEMELDYEDDEEEDDGDDQDFFFTPLEERPSNRWERLQRELQLRSELLQYLGKGLDAAYAQKLQQQEATVQSWTLACARRRQHERRQRRDERRRQRHRQQQLQLLQEQQCSPQELSPSSQEATIDCTLESSDPKVTAVVKPKSLFESSLYQQQQQQQQQQQLLSASPPHPTSSSPAPESSSFSTLSSPQQSTTSSSPFSSPLSFPSYWEFEKYHGIPAVLGLVLACVAHAALYELIFALVLVAMQPFLSYRILTDTDDRILESSSNGMEDICHVVVLLSGLLLARLSGLLFSVSKQPEDEQYQENHVCTAMEDPRRVDRSWAEWTHYTKRGRWVKGALDVLSFYLCLVAVMYFLGRFSLCIDQRASILSDMPSSRHNKAHHVVFYNNNNVDDLAHLPHAHAQQLQIQQHHQQHHVLKHHSTTHLENENLTATDSFSVDSGICPVSAQDVLLPSMKVKVGDSSESDSSDDDDDEEEEEESDLLSRNNVEFDLPECGEHYDVDDDDDDDDDEDNDDHEEKDEFGNPIIYENGREDEEYLFKHLSASAYHQFWGYGYRAPLFDVPHWVFLNLVCSIFAIHTLRLYFGCSFWRDF